MGRRRTAAVQRAGALLLTLPDGEVYHESILSMPAGRRDSNELLHAIDCWTKIDYPARGEA
jgi:hypothetical protein